MKVSPELLELAGTAAYQYGRSRQTDARWEPMYCNGQVFVELLQITKPTDELILSSPGVSSAVWLKYGYDEKTNTMDATNSHIPYLMGRLLGELSKNNIKVPNTHSALYRTNPVVTDLDF